MRSRIFLLTFGATLLVASSAFSETHTFITQSTKDSTIYTCLTTAAGCGTPQANGYCRDRGYEQAKNYRQVDRDEITGAVPTIGSSVGDELFAIECTR